MNVTVADPKVIVALDYHDQHEALALVDRLDPAKCKLKVGKEMFTLFGPQLVNALISRQFKVFLDLKFHDIPVTVAKAVAAAADLGVWMVNVHASGGPRMLDAARESLEGYGAERPHLIAVTVLTSMEQPELNAIGLDVTPQQQVVRLAQLSKACGIDGVVCSAQEASVLRTEVETPFLLVTPGIRPAGAALGDQRRVMTPETAIAAGADYLVIGRPITQADDPIAVLDQINLTL